MRTLLTGFGPFPGVADNPSAQVVEHFAAMPGDGGLVVRVLPVSFAGTAALVPGLLLGGEPFDAALLLGVAARDWEFRLERFARNRRGGSAPDVDGLTPHAGPIVEGAPDVYETPAALLPLLERLRADGAPVRVSEDAGPYVCNHVYFTALHAIREAALPTRCLFLHLPPVSSYQTLDRHIAVVETALAFLARR